MMDWIRAKDRLPDKEGQYLCVTLINGEKYRQLCLWKDDRWYWVPYVLYWTEIPEIPEEEETNG